MVFILFCFILFEGYLLPKHKNLDEEEQLNIFCKQGRAVFGVELKVVDQNNNECPWDGAQ